jgi:hypothetical protein
MMRRFKLVGAVAAMVVVTFVVLVTRGPAQATPLPFTYFLTHYEMFGSMDNPTGVRYHNNGAPFAKAADGSSIAFTGQGGWDPASRRVSGEGTYTIRNRAGAVRRRGTWRATRFISFLQLPGWWGIPRFREEGWQGPPGSVSYSGYLKLRVALSGRGTGALTLWCLMPEVRKPKGHIGDGLSFVGSGLRFTRYREQERGTEGVMFYSPGA